MTKKRVSLNIKKICIGTILGPINKDVFILKNGFTVGGVVREYEQSYMRYTGLVYHIYKGDFYAAVPHNHNLFISPRLVLPPAPDWWLFNKYKQDIYNCFFILRLDIHPSEHSTGFDWVCHEATGVGGELNYIKGLLNEAY